MKRVLVTGTSGFIGSHLASRLASENYAVLGVDKMPPVQTLAGVEQRTCDLLDYPRLTSLIEEWQPDALVHLAARTDLDETKNISGYDANIRGVANLTAAIQRTPTIARAICASSQLVCRIGYTPRHDQDYCPSTLYGESKVLTERIWKANTHELMEWCIVRPTTIWGPRMNPHYLRFFRMIRAGRYYHVGQGPTYKSYGYVGNTVHQLVHLLRAPAAAINRQTFYVADYEPIALEDWAESFRKHLGAPRIRTMPMTFAIPIAKLGDLINALGIARFPFNSFRLRNVRTPYQVDVGPLRAVCGPLPYSMEEGVKETIVWIESVGALDRSPTNTRQPIAVDAHG